MTALIDSEAVFRTRAKAIGLTDGHVNTMKARGWSTLGALAFACAYIPGGSDDSALVTDVSEPVVGNGSPLSSSMRRLYYEAFTMVEADLKHRAEAKGDDTPRKLPLPERSARYERVVKLFPNIDISGPFEPSRQLVDMVVSQVEEGIVRYVGWEQCTSRDQELVNVKKEVLWEKDAQGFLKAREEGKELGADLSSNLRLQQALFRRGVAYETVRLMSWNVHDSVTQLLMRELQRGSAGILRYHIHPALAHRCRDLQEAGRRDQAWPGSRRHGQAAS